MIGYVAVTTFITDACAFQVYDNTTYRHRFYGVIVLFNIFSCVVSIALYYAAKRGHKKEKRNSSDIQLKDENQNGSPTKYDADVEEKLM